MTSEYSNQYTTFDEIYTNETVFIINGNNFSKEQVKQAYMAHHNLLYTDIALTWSFTETTVYTKTIIMPLESFYTQIGQVKLNVTERKQLFLFLHLLNG